MRTSDCHGYQAGKTRVGVIMVTTDERSAASEQAKLLVRRSRPVTWLVAASIGQTLRLLINERRKRLETRIRTTRVVPERSSPRMESF